MGEGKAHQGRPLVVRYIVLMTVVAVVLIGLFGELSYREQSRQMEAQMLAEARVLEKSVRATWDFIDYEQPNINYDRDGSYNFKGLYCSLVGKSVGKLFTMSTDNQYVLRYTRLDPRNALDEPDAFESAALDAFYDEGVSEYTGFVENEAGKREFRYVGAIYLTESCLDCHGGPAGELDVTGFPKEGLQVGDIGGAVSISMPTDLYQAGINRNTLLIIGFFVLFLTVTFGTSLLFFRRRVTGPLAGLKMAVGQMGRGNFRAPVPETGHVREIDELTRGVKAMAGELESLYTTLEEKVDMRTRLYRETNQMLEEQREALARANALLEETNGKLAQENEYRTNIVAILSHELRTPLTSILAFVDLWETSGEEHSRESRECLEKIKTQSQVLLEMVNNALDMVRVESGAVEVAREPIDAVDLAAAVVGAIEPVAQRKGVDVSFEVSPDVPLIRGDWAQMEKILGNLLSNAVKFTDAGGNVRFETTFQSEGARLVFTVADTGIGIASDRLEGIFDRFVQADASISRKYRGSGLGLSLVKKTAEALGGTVSVQSEEGRGSTFTVNLPVELLEEVDDEDIDCR
ncbi:ATP-binding protein [Adlercreutzia sp. R7]|uniref:histidine kinase n=1 Tax=Adlercreutzia wanghongyangiae TaxID=3111451 RepID=A0ABU6IJ39_9ACTN|nr:ATP-binding protein [Adlercreutzia sp. R7]